jgi:hypothetical protein
MSKYLVFCDANVNNDAGVWRVDVNNHVRRISDGTFNPTVGNENVPNLPAMAAVTTAAGVPGVLVYGQDIQTQLINPFFLDGTGTGTVGMGVSELSNVNGSYLGNGLIPQCLMSYDGAVYFNGQVATDNLVGIPTDLWSSDGTAAHTKRITSSDNIPLYPLYMAEAFGNLFFNGFSDGINNLYSYRHPGPPTQIPDPATLVGNFNPYCLAAARMGSATIVLEGEMVFIDGKIEWKVAPPPSLPIGLFMGGGGDNGQVGLYLCDSSATVTLIKDGLNPCNIVSMEWFSPFAKFQRINGAAFFSGLAADGDRQLWISRGTAASTLQLPLPANWGSGPPLDPYNLTPLNGILYFTGADGNGGVNNNPSARGLFSYDPVKDKTTLLFKSDEFDLTGIYESNWNGGPPQSGPLVDVAAGNGNAFTMVAFNNKLYFNCTPHPPQEEGLYVWDPSQHGSTPSILTIGLFISPICLTEASFNN